MSGLVLLCGACGNTQGEQLPRLQVRLHLKGSSLEIPQPDAELLVKASEEYFREASDSPRLIMSDDRIQGIRKKQEALEIIYGSVRVVSWRGMEAHMRRLLIPLSGEFSNGMVFFAGAIASPGDKVSDGDIPDSYGGVNFARNPAGPKRLQDVVQKVISNRRK